MESRWGILSPKGFTLIEVLVVMTIMAMLMTAWITRDQTGVCQRSLQRPSGENKRCSAPHSQ